MHSKSTINSLVTITLILLIFSALTLSFAAAATTSAENKTEFLLSLMQNANTTITETYNRLESQATSIPQDSLNAYNQALLLADEVTSQMQAGDFSEANSKALEALQQFKEALRIVYEVFPETPTEAQITLEKTVALQSAIDRAYLQLQQLENITSFVAASGYNTTMLEANIETITALLTNASRNLNQKSLEVASNNTSAAKTLIENLLSHINNFAATLKIQRVDAYMAQTEARLAALRTQATTTQNTASLTALNSADASLANAKDYLEKQQINETLNALVSSKASEEKAAEHLQPTASVSDPPPTATSPSPTRAPSTSHSLVPSPSPAFTTPTKTPSPTSTPSFAATPP